MNPWLIIGLVGVGAGGIALLAAGDSAADDRPRGLPEGDGLVWKLDPKTGAVTPILDGIPLSQWKPMTANKTAPPYTADEQWNIARTKKYTAIVSAGFAARKRMLPADANPTFIDAYSGELYVIPRLGETPYAISSSTPVPIDEYGRLKPGKYGSGSTTFGPLGLIGSLEALYANPLGKAVINIAIIAGTGGAGVAAIGAYNMWQDRGKELTLKDTALLAARSYAVSQCGEACGMAFDFGVGVASGKSIDEAAEDALYKQMTPEQRAIYDEGKQAYQETVNA